jgi:magnesium and cobalt exporter, CNNM family
VIFLDAVVILILIATNGFFSMSEMAVVSSRSARLKELIGNGTRSSAGARQALDLKETPGRFLSTIQIAITLIGIFSGALGGTTLALPLAAALEKLGLGEPFAGEVSIACVVVSITFATLVFGELVPKGLALSDPEGSAASVARVMEGTATLLTPAVWVLDRVSGAVLGALGRSSRAGARVTEEEIKHLLNEGADSGAIEERERDIMYRIIQMGDKRAEDLMTPRIKMVALDIDAGDQENLARMKAAPTGRFPVYRGDPTNIVGVVGVKDLIDQLPGPRIDLFQKLHPPVFVSDKTTSTRLVQILQTTDLRMVFVVDEYGTMKGLVTLSDITRPVIGETLQGMAGGSAALLRRRDGSYLVDGLRPAADLKAPLGLSHLPGEGKESFHTVAGLIIANLRELPKEGDAFDFGGWRFEVIDMDGQRIDKVLISPLVAAQAASA